MLLFSSVVITYISVRVRVRAHKNDNSLVLNMYIKYIYNCKHYNCNASIIYIGDYLNGFNGKHSTGKT